MWHIAIPIPNLTGFVLGYVAGLATFVAWGIWLNRREKKRTKQMLADLKAKTAQTD